MLPIIQEEKLIKVTKDGVYILSDDIKSKINKKKLSPSMIKSFKDSPAEWVLDSMINPLVQLEEPIYFARGNWFHSIMEHFYANEDRSMESLKESFREVTRGDEKYTDLARTDDNREWILNCMKGYKALCDEFGINEKKVANVYHQGQNKKGLELFVSGSINNAACLGFVDCIFEEEGGLKIVDWKTGKYYKGDEGYELQQTIYSILLEKYGFTVGSAALAFPVGTPSGPVIEEIDIHNPEVIGKVEKIVAEVDEEFTKCKEEWFFPFRRHRWNSWETYLTGNGTARKPNIDEDRFANLADLEAIM